MHSFESKAADGLSPAQALRLHLVEQTLRAGGLRDSSVEGMETFILSKVPVLDRVLLTLNRAAAADPEAVSRLIDSRVRCNQALADDPTILCGKHPEHLEMDFEIGFLGLLNGILEDLGEEKVIAACYSQRTGKLTNFSSFNPKHHQEARTSIAAGEFVSDEEFLAEADSQVGGIASAAEAAAAFSGAVLTPNEIRVEEARLSNDDALAAFLCKKAFSEAALSPNEIRPERGVSDTTAIVICVLVTMAILSLAIAGLAGLF